MAYRAGRPIAAGQFLADLEQLAALIPAGAAVLNDCADRYRFAVGLAAAFTADRVSLLPPTHTPEVVRQIRAMTPEAVCLTDHRDCHIDLPRIFFPDTDTDAAPFPALAGSPDPAPTRRRRCVHFRLDRTAGPAPQALGSADEMPAGCGGPARL